ncbi:MAG: hypothetical protein IJ600_05780 [Lachnospiraceae bacterium]|nr:hypothetical protein [Lachnospiraceae bacterium]
MNKQFETEYKEMIHAELPDLWGRIEAKIDAQEAEPEKRNDQKEQGQAADVSTMQGMAADQKPAVIRKIRWRRYLPAIAAAALCIVIAIPAVRMTKLAQMEEDDMAQMAAAGYGSMEETAEAFAEEENGADEAMADAADNMVPAAAQETEEAELKAGKGADIQNGGIANNSVQVYIDGSDVKTEAAAEAVAATGSAQALQESVRENSEWDAVESRHGESGHRNLIQLEENGRLYADNVVILSVKEDTPKAAMEGLAEEYGMTILYAYENFNMYAMQLEQGLTAEEMKAFLKELEENEYVLLAEPDGIMQAD